MGICPGPGGSSDLIRGLPGNRSGASRTSDEPKRHDNAEH
jgi:hypothetical protein